MSTHEPSDSGAVGPPSTNRKAVYSVACGIVAFACIYVTPVLGLIIALPSVTSGVHARREIVASKGAQTGDSLAVIGLMIGAGAIVTVMLSLLLSAIDAG